MRNRCARPGRVAVTCDSLAHERSRTGPTGYSGVLPRFGDQREVGLLVEAGPIQVEAIKIATRTGALDLGRLDSIGTLAPGKRADLILMKGNPAKDITDIEEK